MDYVWTVEEKRLRAGLGVNIISNTIGRLENNTHIILTPKNNIGSIGKKDYVHYVIERPLWVGRDVPIISKGLKNVIKGQDKKEKRLDDVSVVDGPSMQRWIKIARNVSPVECKQGG